MIVFVLAALVQIAAPSPANAPDAISADELFARARAKARARIAHLPPYVEYRLDANFARKGKNNRQHFRYVIRTSDGKQFEEHVPDSPSDRIDTTPNVNDGSRIFSPFTTFDLRPKRAGERLSQFEAQSTPEPQPSASPGETVIGRVATVTRVYDVTLVGRERLHGTEVWHLHTKANFDERHHPIVDIYTRVTDDEPVRIDINVTASAGPLKTRPTIAFSYADFDGTWMVSELATDITMRMLFLSFGGTINGTISHVTYPQSEPDWMFDERLLKEHLAATPAKG